MSTLDDIAQERQRLSDRLTKLDGERERLLAELAELDAAERVLARFTHAGPRRRGRPRRDAESAARTQRRDQRPRRFAAADKSGMSLGDATMRAVHASEGGVSAEAVRNYLAREFGMDVRPNHLGMALQRHRRAGRLQQHEQLWFPAAAS